MTQERIDFRCLSEVAMRGPAHILCRTLCKFVLGCCLALATVVLFGSAHAKSKDKVLHSFSGTDGTGPSGLIYSGDLYGTTSAGGGNNDGTVFRLSSDGTLTVLHSFDAEDSDGAEPSGSLVMDTSGNLYGTTMSGGANGDGGIVFKLAPDGTETVLHNFTGGRDGIEPFSGLIGDKKGNLYGTTVDGGKYSGGTVFRVTRGGKETVLFAFDNESEANPWAGLIMDTSGNLYGTTYGKGAGSVFKLAPDGTETVLYSFGSGGQDDGANPEASLIMDRAGDLYGTTIYGGGTGCVNKTGCGTVFKLTANGTETVLYSFTGGSDGAYPEASLIMDSSGNLYGTTDVGGNKGCVHRYGCGTVFELAPDGTETVLHAFKNDPDGANPAASLILDSSGDLYGTTSAGGAHGLGTVFELKE